MPGGQSRCCGEDETSVLLLTDEVCDITNIEQLVTFIKFADVNLNQATTQFIAIDDLLKDSSSANATNIKNTVMKQL